MLLDGDSTEEDTCMMYYNKGHNLVKRSLLHNAENHFVLGNIYGQSPSEWQEVRRETGNFILNARKRNNWLKLIDNSKQKREQRSITNARWSQHGDNETIGIAAAFVWGCAVPDSHFCSLQIWQHQVTKFPIYYPLGGAFLHSIHEPCCSV